MHVTRSYKSFPGMMREDLWEYMRRRRSGLQIISFGFIVGIGILLGSRMIVYVSTSSGGYIMFILGRREQREGGVIEEEEKGGHGLVMRKHKAYLCSKQKKPVIRSRWD